MTYYDFDDLERRLRGCRGSDDPDCNCTEAANAIRELRNDRDALRMAVKDDATWAQENAALRADAERYRFLRDRAFGKHGGLSLLSPDAMDAEVDAAIDAARAKPK